jgi:hypothetical protein
VADEVDRHSKRFLGFHLGSLAEFLGGFLGGHLHSPFRLNQPRDAGIGARNMPQSEGAAAETMWLCLLGIAPAEVNAASGAGAVRVE